MARGRKSLLKLVLSNDERSNLQRFLRSTTAPNGQVRRARAILLLEEKQPITHIARLVDMSPRHVRRWGRRFLKDRCFGLGDLPRSGRPPVFSPRSSYPRCQTCL